MKKNNIIQYITYLLSYLIAYPVEFMILMFIGFGSESPVDPMISSAMADILLYMSYAILTFVTPFILNIGFKRIMNLKKNTKASWTIFILHFFLIPAPIVFLWFFMRINMSAL